MSQKHKHRRAKAPGIKPVSTGNGEIGALTPALPAGRPVAQAAERTWLETWAVRISRWLGSLQVAVILLVLFAIALMLGVIVEQQFNAKTAGELVYRSWWFALLLLLLGVNIFFAAAKKWPWKKHQTGFLITHVGLLTMLAGGILNALGGTDAQMQLIDTDDPQIARGFLPQESNRILFTDVATLQVKKLNAKEEHKGGWKSVGESDFIGGPLPWKADTGPWGFREGMLAFLDFLRNPLPRSWSMSLADGARLEVLNFYPQSKHDAYSPARQGQEGGPAFKVQLHSPRFPEPMEDWLADRKREFGGGRAMPALVEFMGTGESSLLNEFLEPPPPADLGSFGVLAVCVDGKPHRFVVDKHLGQTVAVGETGYRIRITGFRPVFRDKDTNQPPENPVVEFDLIAKDGVVGEYFAMARSFLGHLIPQAFFDPDKRKPIRDERAGVKVWYHPPDYRYGREGVRGVLQFVQTKEDRKLYYRSFNSKVGGFNFESAGEVKKNPEAEYPIWSGMNWKFRVLEQLPEAVQEDRYTYRELKQNEKPGEDGTAVLRCRLVVGGRPGQEFWLAQDGPKTVAVDGSHYRLEYGMKAKNLPFSIKLERAESTVDPGTQQAATYTSYVQLTDKEKGIEGERRIITMNEPLEHRGYNFYQSDYAGLGVFSGGKPVSRSGFTVAYDPGLLFKYAGTCLLPLGVAVMFYMKAYLFKPRGRRETSLADSSPS